MEVIIETPFGEVAVLLVMAALIGFLGMVLRPAPHCELYCRWPCGGAICT